MSESGRPFISVRMEIVVCKAGLSDEFSSHQEILSASWCPAVSHLILCSSATIKFGVKHCRSASRLALKYASQVDLDISAHQHQWPSMIPPHM